jgi:hypothetical protein
MAAHPAAAAGHRTRRCWGPQGAALLLLLLVARCGALPGWLKTELQRAAWDGDAARVGAALQASGARAARESRHPRAPPVYPPPPPPPLPNE